MSTPEDAAVGLLVTTLAQRADPLPDRWLVVGPGHGRLALPLELRGTQVQVWRRVAGTEVTALPAPPPGPVDAVALRLPRGRAGREYAIELCCHRLVPGGELWAYGPNDEGAKSAGKALAPWCHEIEAVDARRHCRLWRARRGDAPARGTVDAHLRVVQLALPGGTTTFQALPGVFAKARLDPASALLLDVLPSLDLGQVSHVVDFGCGMGVLSAGVLQRWPQAQVVALDHDAVAVESTARSVSGVRAICGDGWAALAGEALPPADLVVSNPPLHTGNALDPELLARFARGAAARLAPGGHVLAVTQRQRPLATALEAAVGTTRLVGEGGQFRVWLAQRR